MFVRLMGWRPERNRRKIVKRIHAASIVAIVLWGTVALIPVTHARGGGQTDIRKSGQTLDDSGLQSMLEGLGYEPKKLSKGYLIAVKKDTWTFNMQFVLSADNSRLGMNANLGKVDNPEQISAAEW